MSARRWKPAAFLGLMLAPLAARAQIFVSTGAASGLRMYIPNGNDWWLDPALGRLDVRVNGGASPLASFLSSGTVGIGTTSPLNALHVQGTGGGAAGIYLNSAVPFAAAATLYNSGGSLYWAGSTLSTGAANPWAAATGGIGYLGGNVGVGTTSPAATLHVSSAASSGSTFLMEVSTGTGTGQQLLVIQANGEVGIGTSSPANSLDVNGSFHVKGTPGGVLSATGGTITTIAGTNIHTFNASGTFTPSGPGNVQVLVVAGGGGGGTDSGGGGGAGGLIYNASYAVTAQAYSVTVGGGGVAHGSGGNSVFGTLTAVGGGAGSGQPYTPGSGGSGGGASGGGGSTSGAAGTSGQGNAGGGSNQNAPNYPGGGGGGAGAAGGTPANSSANAGSGGVGLAYSISGASVYYAGGGGGGSIPAAGGAGGNGGGGASGSAGTANTGGGGGSGAAGGSGVVIVSYLSSTVDSFQVTSSGNVGIGTTNPSATLQVNGPIIVSGCTGCGAGTSQWTTQGSNIYFNTGDVGIGTAPLNTLDVNGGAAIGTYAGVNAAPSFGLIVSGNVGIGTTSPLTKLNILDTGNTATGGLLLQGSGGGNASTANAMRMFAAGSPNAGNILFGDGTGWKLNFGKNSDDGATKFVTIQDNGNVGIGTTSPANKLDVNGSEAIGTFAGSAGPSNSLVVSGDLAIGTTTVKDSNLLTIVGDQASSNVGVVLTNTNSSSLHTYSLQNIYGNFLLFDYTRSATPLTVNSSGNVGVGTTTPQQTLSVNGNMGVGGFAGTAPTPAVAANGLAVSGGVSIGTTTSGSLGGGPVGLNMYSASSTAGPSILLQSGDTGGRQYYLSSSASGNGTGAGYFRITDETAPADRLVINPSGNVGIGTTSPIATYNTNLTVSNKTSGDSAGVIVEGNGPSSSNVFGGLDFENNGSRQATIQGYNDGGATTSGLGFYTSNAGSVNTNAMSIRGNGRVGIGTTSPGATLDVTGSANVSGTLSLPGMSKLRAHLSASTAIANNTTTGAVFNVVDFDVLSEFNSTTGKITLAQDGYYWVNAKIQWFGGPSGNRMLLLYKNNGGNAWVQDIEGPDSTTLGNMEAGNQVSTFQHLSAGDVIDVRVFQGSGGSLQIAGGTEQCYIEMFRVP